MKGCRFNLQVKFILLLTFSSPLTPNYEFKALTSEFLELYMLTLLCLLKAKVDRFNG